MRRVLRLAPLLAALLPLALLWVGALGLREAVLAAAALEGLLALASGGVVLLGFRRMRRKGRGLREAAEKALSAVMPSAAARLVVAEQIVLWCLLRRALGGREPESGEFPYHRRSSLRVLVPLVLLLSPAELGAAHLLVHLLSPWPSLGWALLALEVYALLWLAGLCASLSLLPHRLEGDGIRLRYGAHAEVFVPYAEIREVLLHPARPAGKTSLLFPAEGLAFSREEGEISIPVGGRTDLSLRLRSPASARGLLRARGPAGCVRFAADEPERLAAELGAAAGFLSPP